MIWGVFNGGQNVLNAPVDIEVDDSGGVYVVDQNNHRIRKFTEYGFFLTGWGTNGSGAGQFAFPSGIAVDPDFNTPGKGGVYVVDRDNDRVQKFDSTGAFIMSWGSTGSGDGQFMAPQGIAVDADGNTFIADTGNNRVQVFDSEGTFITSFGSFGTATGEFDTPLDVAVNRNGDVYVSDSGNNRIQKFNPPGGGTVDPDPGTDAAPDLLENFDLLDSNPEDGFLSLAEAQVQFPGLSQATFDALDTNGDGLLSEAELTFSGDGGGDGGGGGGGGGGGDGGGDDDTGTDGESSGGGGNSCFIATAAYGTPMADEIVTLRVFRDEHMLTNGAGHAFTDTYYRVSPAIADIVASHPTLAAVVRAILSPIVALVQLGTPGLAGALALMLVVAGYRRRKAHARIIQYPV